MKKIYESPSYVLIDIAKEDVILTSFQEEDTLDLGNKPASVDRFSWEIFS